ncbi:hypothetical protein SAICODRAFT_123588 [Saitoella complicata NRRL Y-17804]|uniref:uncharacterized protein n=1 Tax=Saitoella complicata (strain BCRC 22490 / CBS 7301 / JCM 7358 / NBRC 10748 / NRRL Y-17804) TaxID=698492 RepID=UPI00086828DB|nr:uncharacterized protein SAICODRAFT_123588 [Saitoella complicata NRRL Y-17804]ODQ53023.1 hypothetical protein SAICODRAFT_123588 [Saitoella complicata NRRL Y-17804]
MQTPQTVIFIQSQGFPGKLGAFHTRLAVAKLLPNPWPTITSGVGTHVKQSRVNTNRFPRTYDLISAFFTHISLPPRYLPIGACNTVPIALPSSAPIPLSNNSPNVISCLNSLLVMGWRMSTQALALLLAMVLQPAAELELGVAMGGNPLISRRRAWRVERVRVGSEKVREKGA